MIKKLLIIFIVITFILGFTFLEKTPKESGQFDKSKAVVHLVTNIKKDDGPPCVAFDVVLANVKLGKKVEFFLNSEAAWNLKRDKKDGENDFDRYEVPQDLKELVYQQFKDKEILELKNFGEFLSFLNKKGVTITVGGTWNVLTGV
jgi:predicted peroxiredoxin